MDVNGNDNTPEWGYCRVAGCPNDAIPCYDSGGPPDDPDDLLCADHCQQFGYCWGCGRLWAGNEQFDFSPRGLCGECIHQVARTKTNRSRGIFAICLAHIPIIRSEAHDYTL